eukprot:1156582-Pelagomonas_calceolata.AAC.2
MPRCANTTYNTTIAALVQQRGGRRRSLSRWHHLCSKEAGGGGGGQGSTAACTTGIQGWEGVRCVCVCVCEREREKEREPKLSCDAPTMTAPVPVCRCMHCNLTHSLRGCQALTHVLECNLYSRSSCKSKKVMDKEERARRLAEMSNNAEQHDMARSDRLQRAAAADAARDGVVANSGMGDVLHFCPGIAVCAVQIGLCNGREMVVQEVGFWAFCGGAR